jgi:hypothetical protein
MKSGLDRPWRAATPRMGDPAHARSDRGAVGGCFHVLHGFEMYAQSSAPSTPADWVS